MVDEKGYKNGQDHEVDKKIIDTGRSGGSKLGRATKSKIVVRDRE